MIQRLYNDNYCRNFILAINESKESIDQYLSTYLEVPIAVDVDCAGFVENYTGKDQTITFIYIKDNSEDVFNMGTIVHECYHAAHYMFKIVGIKIDTDNDDVGAYVIDWIFRQVLAAIRESKEQ